jgi:DNA modification methylase
MNDYDKFLKSKMKSHQETGFEISESKLNKKLFDFQKFIVSRCLKLGKSAIFADCGLGKTPMQLEWAHQVSKKEKKPVLILTPLAVALQTIQEGIKFDTEVKKYDGSKFPIQISNYEQLDNIDCSLFAGVVLDESSILKNFTGVMRNKLIDNFAKTKYKLCCTATPSPNDPMELGNHSEFLNVMGRSEMLSMYFIHDGGETAKWRIKRHAKKIFYQWVNSWSVMLANPKDIGFNGDNFILPKLNFIEHKILTDVKESTMKLFNDNSVNATSFNAELRVTVIPRLEKVKEIVDNSDENFIVWIKQNEEGDKIKNMFDCVEVRGNETTESKEKKLLAFAKNEFRVLVTKSKIAQFGLNFQNCNNQIFASLDFSFEQLYQSIRRSYRFGQKKEVHIYIITTDTMENVVSAIREKEKQFHEMQNLMVNNIHQLNKKPIMKKENKKIIKEDYTLINGDCVAEIKNIPDESISLSVFSPPFADLYCYSDSIEDMGNSKDYKEFMVQFTFLVKELFRVLMSGHNVAVHCIDLPIQKGREGFIGLRDFSNMIRIAFEDVGFIYHSRITIWKDPVIEMQRTKALGLLHKQIKKDSTMSRVGLPDYVLVFRKDGERNNPVKCNIPVDIWQKYASPVWLDINYSDTLQFRTARDNNDEKHICPLQIPTIERLITLYSNEGETVFSPFAGIGSEIYQAVKMNRKGIGIELKESYFNVMVKNLENCIKEKQAIEDQLQLIA